MFKAVGTVVTLAAREVMQLQEILMDENGQDALAFLRDVLGEKVRCAQAESHRPEFEGGTGKEAVHYTQKGEAHPAQEEDESG